MPVRGDAQRLDPATTTTKSALEWRLTATTTTTATSVVVGAAVVAGAEVVAPGASDETGGRWLNPLHYHYHHHPSSSHRQAA